MTLIISFISKHGLFSKSVPNFWRLLIKQSYMISKNPLRMSIWMQKSIEFHLPHYEIPHATKQPYHLLLFNNGSESVLHSGSNGKRQQLLGHDLGLFLAFVRLSPLHWKSKRVLSLLYLVHEDRNDIMHKICFVLYFFTRSTI